MARSRADALYAWGMTTESERLRTVVAGPKAVTVDGNTVTQHSPREVIEADRYLRANDAAKRGGMPIRTIKLRPPGGAG